MRPLGVAVVGAGYWGPNLARNIQSVPRMRLEWVCDVDEDRARAAVGRYSTVRTTAELTDVIDDPRVDAVAIATPAQSHVEIARAALTAGKHVLVEKPLATTSAAAAGLVGLADRHELVLMCDHTYCYTPAVRKIRELVHSGVLGDIQYVDSVRVNLGLVQRDVDVLWDLAPHDLSIMDFVLPASVKPTTVAAHGADPIGAGHACIAYLVLGLTGSAIAHAHVNWLSPIKIRKMIIGGSKRTLVWDDLTPGQRVSLFDRGVDLSTADDLDNEERRELIISYRTGDMVAPALPEHEALRGVTVEFCDAIRDRRSPLTDGRAGLRVLSVLEAASASLARGGAVIRLADQY